MALKHKELPNINPAFLGTNAFKNTSFLPLFAETASLYSL